MESKAYVERSAISQRYGSASWRGDGFGPPEFDQLHVTDTLGCGGYGHNSSERIEMKMPVSEIDHVRSF